MRRFAPISPGVAPVVALVVGLVLGGAARPVAAQEPVRAGGPRITDPVAVVKDAGRTIQERFYDRDRVTGAAFDAALAAAVSSVRRDGATLADAHAAVRDLLAGLDASHSGIVPGPVYERDVLNELYARPSPRLGAELVELPDGIFVSDLYAGSPAARAGVRVGDRLVLVDGTAAADSPRVVEGGGDVDKPRRLVFDAGPAGTPAELDLERRRGAFGRYRVRVLSEPLSLSAAAAASARVVELPDGVSVGTIRFYHFLSDRMAAALVTAIEGAFVDADALVIDLRGRGGRPSVLFLVLDLLSPGEKQRWTRPVVFLTDHGSRSAKEVFAWHVRKRRLGPIVGENTAGAVLGATFLPLVDGSQLMLPRRDVRDLTEGDYLEGKGVAPDVIVEQLPLPWREGRDPIAERGIAVAAHRARLARRGAVVPD